MKSDALIKSIAVLGRHILSLSNVMVNNVFTLGSFLMLAIIPVVKNKQVDIACVHNYSAIDLYRIFLNACIAETTWFQERLFNTIDSSLFIIYLDASKAFDGLRYSKPLNL